MKPMKPSTIEDLDKLRFPFLASPKIDGFRLRTAEDGTAMTSNWKPVVNGVVQDVFRTLALAGLDGEATVGKPNAPGVLQRTSSGLTSREGNPKFTLHLFDHFGFPSEPFQKRLDRAKAAARGIPCIKLVKHQLVRNLEEFHIFNAWCIANGYEGAMYRDPMAPYKFGRSTPKEGWLWRYKPTVDSEARITGWYEEEANTNEAKEDELGRMRRSSSKKGKVGKGTLGGFEGVDIHDGKPVRIGIGFTAAQRKEFWERGLAAFTGTLIKYKKQMAGEADKPRHQVFLDFRDPADL